MGDRPLGDPTDVTDSTAPGATAPAVPVDLVRAATELRGSLNPRRTALQLLRLVTADLADWAMVAAAGPHGDSLTLNGGSSPGTTYRVPAVSVAGTALDQVLRSGSSELLHVSADDPRTALAQIVPQRDLGDEAAALRPAEVLAVALGARGVRVGVLVLVRRAGRGFRPDEMALAEEIAEHAAVAVHSARLYEDLATVTSVLEASLRPESLPEVEGLGLAVMFRPAATNLEVGGDFYDVHVGSEDSLVVLGDICGKGVEATVLNGRARQSIQTAAVFDRRPAEILQALNTVLASPSSHRFVTVACARVRPERERGSAEVEVAVAGHEPPLVVRSSGEVVTIDATGPLAGVLPSPLDFTVARVELEPGDALVLFSDGITDARGESGELYGLDRLRAVASRYAGLPPVALREAIEQDVVDYVGSRGHDDMTLLVVGPRQ